MFPPLTASRRPQKRSFAALVRDAVDTALAFATLGEATSQGFVEEPSAAPGHAASARRAPTAPGTEHPHRRQIGRAPQPGLCLAGPSPGAPQPPREPARVTAGLLGRRPPAGRDWEVSRAPAGRAPELHPPSGRPLTGAARERGCAAPGTPH